MCLPPDVSTPALHPVGRRRDANPYGWSTDPQAHPNWGAPPQAAGAAFPSWVEFFSLPQSGFAKDDACASNVIEAAPLGSLLASALAQQEIPKTWQPQPNWAASPTNSFYCSPQPVHSSYGGGIDAAAALMQSAQGSQPDMEVSACTKSMMPVPETLSSLACRGMESLERPKEEEKSQAGSLFDELYQEGRSEQEAAAKKFSTPMGKTVKTGCHKTKQAARPGVKKENASVKGEFMGESDMEASDDDGEGIPVISEKRQRRMLSNRASAQRSRQRRQERLDTLEVLVAQLRMENAALKTKANTAAASINKLEDENRLLRERLDAKEQNRESQVSARKDGTDNDNHSLHTTGGNNDMSRVENSQDSVTVSMEARTWDSDSSSENSNPNKRDPNKREAELNTANINSGIVNQPSKKKRSCEIAFEKDWSFNPDISTVFGTENIESAGDSICKMKPKSPLTVGMITDYGQEYESLKGLISLPQIPAFTQETAAFDIDLEHSPDIDKKLLDSVEEIWLDGFSDICFK